MIAYLGCRRAAPAEGSGNETRDGPWQGEKALDAIQEAAFSHGYAVGHNLSALRACERSTRTPLACGGRLRLTPMDRWPGLC